MMTHEHIHPIAMAINSAPSTPVIAINASLLSLPQVLFLSAEVEQKSKYTW